MVEVREAGHDASWLAAARGEAVDWRALLGRYGAAVDWPASAFYPALMDAFPEAKVLLTLRDPGRWYESVMNTIFQASRRGRGDPANVHRQMVDAVVWDGIFGGRIEDRAHAIAVFEKHNEEVVKRVPAERLLVYEVKQGWAPLAALLGVEVPATPFPHLNDTVAFQERFMRD
jgi:hypothetical protein